MKMMAEMKDAPYYSEWKRNSFQHPIPYNLNRRNVCKIPLD